MNDSEIFNAWRARAGAICAIPPAGPIVLPQTIADGVRWASDEALAWLQGYVEAGGCCSGFDWADCWFISSLNVELGSVCLLPHLIALYDHLDGAFDNDYSGFPPFRRLNSWHLWYGLTLFCSSPEMREVVAGMPVAHLLAAHDFIAMLIPRLPYISKGEDLEELSKLRDVMANVAFAYYSRGIPL